MVKPIWKELVEQIRNHQDQNFNPYTFEKLFGAAKDNFLSFVFLEV